jgi:hypothetical protein
MLDSEFAIGLVERFCLHFQAMEVLFTECAGEPNIWFTRTFGEK